MNAENSDRQRFCITSGVAHPHGVRIRLLIVSAVALVLLIASFSQSRGRVDSGVLPAQSANAVRQDILRRVKVWQPPPIEIERATLRTDGGIGDEVDCRFLPSHLSGTSAKFDCVLPTDEEVRVKYRGPERVGEAVATTLLRTLGFGADDVRLVRKVRCRGCPLEPFYTGRIVSALGALSPYSRSIDYDHERTFEWAAIERKFPGEAILIGHEGWAWWELADTQASVAGPARAQLDAFLLMAVFLAHWDNKTQNQRLVCPPGEGTADAGCRRPLALIQDTGATFGPRKVDFDGWRAAPIWEDRNACITSMASLPYNGGTFGRVRISEDGRRFLADLLTRLSRVQIVELFRSARIEHEAHLGRAYPADAWADEFMLKTRQIAEGPPCAPETGGAE